MTAELGLPLKGGVHATIRGTPAIEAVATDTIFSNPGAGDSVAQLVLDLGRRLARGARDSANNQRDRQ